MAKTNVVLIGMPGAGKSTVGVVLAKMLNKNFIDTDILIQQRFDSPLQQMIDELGCEGFIERENEVLCELDEDDCIIATGGSAVYSQEGMNELSKIADIVYLRAGLDEIISRIGDFDERGIVFREGRPSGLAGLLEQRRPLYEKFADLTVDIDGQSVADVARSICQALEVRE